MILTPTVIASLDVYSGKVLMVDAVHHTSSYFPESPFFDDHFSELWTRTYLHNLPIEVGIQIPKGPTTLTRVKNCPSLQTFDGATSAGLLYVNVSGSTSLSELAFGECALRDIDISGAPLVRLRVAVNNITRSIDFSNLDPLWTDVELNNNQISSIAITASNSTDGSHGLSNLLCNDNILTNLVITSSNLDDPTTVVGVNLICYRNKLPQLDISNCSQLTVIDCGNNSITSLDFSRNPVLYNINCKFNQLTTLNVSGTLCRTLDCSNNNLPQSQVDKVLLDLSQSKVINGTLTMVGPSMASPSNIGPTPTGAQLRLYLTSSGWYVKDNDGIWVAPLP